MKQTVDQPSPRARSLRLRLALWLSSSIVAVAALAGAYALWQAFDEMHELQDDLLRQVAVWVRQTDGAAMQGLREDAGADMFDIDDDTQITVQFLGRGQDAGDVHLPETLPDGLQTYTHDHTGYRVLVHSLSDGRRFAVLQETSVRNEIAGNSALRTVLPVLLLAPLLVLLVVLLVRHMLKPVAALANEVDARSQTDLRPIAQQALPAEIQPFARAINRLLARVEQAMTAQRRFVADAAHELRSPMTALSLQAQRLADAEMPADARERLRTLQQGIDRNRRLLNQLLAMARAQEASERLPEPVALDDIFRQALADLLPLAEAKQIDIGIAENAPGHGIRLRAHALDVSAVIKNLLDNAIRYAPNGGQVDLSARLAEQGNLVIEVEDNGPGIPASERARVLDAFYRVPGNEQSGSGLGLSIAKTIVDRWGGQMELLDAERFPEGLLVRIRVPETLIS